MWGVVKASFAKAVPSPACASWSSPATTYLDASLLQLDSTHGATPIWPISVSWLPIRTLLLPRQGELRWARNKVPDSSACSHFPPYEVAWPIWAMKACHHCQWCYSKVLLRSWNQNPLVVGCYEIWKVMRIWCPRRTDTFNNPSQAGKRYGYLTCDYLGISVIAVWHWALGRVCFTTWL